jgi:membrane protein
MVNKRILRLVRILTGTDSGTRGELIQLEGRLERFLHFWVLVGKSFIRNRCLIRASALSYSSLLALIPLLAVAISVTSSLLKTQGEDKIYQAVDKFVSYVMPPASVSTNGPAVSLNLSPGFSAALTPTNAVAGETATNAVAGADAADTRVLSAQKEAAKSIHDFIQRTRSGALGVVGMLLLVFVAIRMLANVEATFNDIWGVTRGRSWLWSTVLYWTTITLGPLALVGALGLAGSSHLHAVSAFFQQMPVIGELVFQFVPLALLWLVFGLAYLLVPNTRVKFSAALVGGVVGGSLWHVNNLFGFLYVSRVVSNSKIYGSLGLVPVFMIGLYFSWAILLFGAQVAYAFQNRKSYLQDRLVENVNQRGREFVALRLMTLIGQRFQAGGRPATLAEISAELGVPGRLAQQVLQTLLGTRLVTETVGAETGYAPARPLDAINAWQILLAMRAGNGQEISLLDGPARSEVIGEFARIEEAERQAASSVTMLALVNRTQPRPGIAASDQPSAENPTPSASAVEIAAAPETVAEPPLTDEKPPVKIPPAPAAARPDVIRPDENREFPL